LILKDEINQFPVYHTVFLSIMFSSVVAKCLENKKGSML